MLNNLVRFSVAAYACDLSVAAAIAANLSITERGATPGGEALNTHAIQSTIDEVAASGGGAVIVPRGVFKTGALFLKQGVELHLADGAVLLGSTDINDYPKRMTRIEGHFEPWRMALVNASNLSDARITGTGTLDGNGRPYWKTFWRRRLAREPNFTNLAVERPRLVYLEACNDVTVTGIHLKDSGFWNLHLYKCRDVTVQGLTITAPNGDPPRITDISRPWDEISIDRAPSSDGIDVDSCQNVFIRDCIISVGDDCIALKGSKGLHALEDTQSPPVENIAIEDCHLASGHGAVTCGSEATVVRNVLMRNCRIGAGVPVVRMKLRTDTPQRYENLVFEDLILGNAQALFDVKPWSQFEDLKGAAPPPSLVSNLTLRNISGSIRSLGDLRCITGNCISNLVLENIELSSEQDVSPLAGIDGLRMRNVRVNGAPLGQD